MTEFGEGFLSGIGVCLFLACLFFASFVIETEGRRALSRLRGDDGH